MLLKKKKTEELGYINQEIPENLDIHKEIEKLRKEKNVVLLAHYYQTGDIQDIADHLGDSLGLSQKAAKNNADIILFAGVNFMAETAKILSPEKKVLIPDLNAGCSLANSCAAKEFREFIKKYPDHTVITYVNTTAEIKALTDISCTSANAVQIVDSLPREEKIIFGPDRNLGNYVNEQTGRNMVLWHGGCHVHENFSIERIMEMKRGYPDAEIIAHPECEKKVLDKAEHVGSTTSLLKYSRESRNKTFIVVTEPGIIHQMKKENPGKTFLPAPPKNSHRVLSECEFMKLITMEKIYLTLKYEMPEVRLDENIRKKAEEPIRKMLEISEKAGL